MKKRTAKTIDQVRAWIESTEHHIAQVEGERFIYGKMTFTHMLLKGYNEQLRIPIEIWEQCHIKPSERFDDRMYRWDFDKEKEILFGYYVKPKDVRVQVNGFIVKHEHHTMCYDKQGVYTGQMQDNADGSGEIFIGCLIREGKPAIGIQDGWEHVPNLTPKEMRQALRR